VSSDQEIQLNAVLDWLESSACRSADRAAARRDGGKHRTDSGEVDGGRAAIPDASLTDIKASKLSAMSIEDIGAHHVQGDVALLAGPGDLGDAITAIGRHPIAHGFSKAGQQPSARIAYFRQGRAPSLRHLGQIAVDVDSIASHDPIVRMTAGRRTASTTSQNHLQLIRKVYGERTHMQSEPAPRAWPRDLARGEIEQSLHGPGSPPDRRPEGHAACWICAPAAE